MNDWTDDLISRCLADVPQGKYRCRAEKELRDHMETLCLSLTESGMSLDQARREALRTMGEPGRLQEEYRAAWRRTLPGRLDALGRLLKAWTVGCAMMGGVNLLMNYILHAMWDMAVSLPWNSHDKWVRLLRNTLWSIIGDLSSSYTTWYLPWWLPLVLALLAGALYLGYQFRRSSHPAPVITAGLCLHWAGMAAFNGGWYACVRPHAPFWEAVECHFSVMAWHYRWTFALCIVLGLVFGCVSKRKWRPAAA